MNHHAGAADSDAPWDRGALRAPFPYFGGKGRAAALIWSRIGEVESYVEPFFGSGAVLLARPTAAKIETVNDKHGYLANFWRAIQAHPRTVARYADGPVNEADLHARHRWLVERGPELHRKLLSDPLWCDPQIAGWWVWGASCWIGRGWCSSGQAKQIPHLGSHAGRGVHSQKRPHLTPNGGGQGHGRGVAASGQQLPKLSYQAPGSGVVYGQGVHSQGPRLSQQMPSVGLSGTGHPGVHGAGRTEGIYAWFAALSQRLRRVRVCCGDWSRVMGPSVIYGNGITGIVLDPPYAHDLRHADLYAEESATISADVRRWAIEHGDDPRLRIALCGYEGEHDMPATWERIAWKANGGYGNASGNANRHRERIWFSPHCLDPKAQRGAQLALGVA